LECNFCAGPWSNAKTSHTGKWTKDEDSKLKDAVQTYGGKNWNGISALVPGRTKCHCKHRWYYTLDPSIDRVNERKGKWTVDEDSKLQDAVLTHGDKDWKEVAALVLGRTRKQCCSRWRDMKLNCSTVLGREPGTRINAPALGQDPRSL
jgi:hypothetical protein